MRTPETQPARTLPEWLSMRQLRWILFLFVAAVAAMPFMKSLSYGFHRLDDATYMQCRPLVDPFSAESLREAFFRFHFDNWHPVTWVSWMIDKRFFGARPEVFRAGNILLHSANACLLLFWLSRRTGRIVPAFWAAVIFGIHPQHVESVVWISERKDVLSTFFLMLTVCAYDQSFIHSTKLRGFWYGLSCVLCLTGLMSKGMLVTVPLLLMILEAWSVRFNLNAAWLKKTVPRITPFLLISVAVAALTILAQSNNVVKLTGLPLPFRLTNAIVSYVRYTGAFFWPSQFSISYPMPPGGWPSWVICAAGVLLISISAIAIFLRRDWSFLLAGWLWFVIAAIPIIGIVQVGLQSMADRYAYIPSIGLAVLACYSFESVCLRLDGKRSLRAVRQTLKCVPFMVSIGLLWQCDHVVGIWKSDETLFQHALLIEPENNYLAHRALGDFYCDEQKVEQAVYHYTEALRCIPESSDSIVNSARELLRNGETTRAVVFVRAGLEADETDPSLWLMLGNAMLAVRNPNEAKQCFHRAITYNPSSSEAFNNLGLLEQDPAKAAELFSSAIRFDSRNAPAYVNLGNVFARQRQFGRAADCYRVAIELADLPEAHANLQAVTPLIQNE